ncbi:beta-1,4-N-acetylgalactosaminyltransferase bre-4-like isoform X3 [Crassostrea angulata]|uniref:beta-1,4-N-acetylgalactosaminyltransferase bre-4-like isoform X3 n=1 Tax=Magallana angulata TaxID=2784310 RepID=UPI0022B111DA|nr:beta-1,4-N-acetylgalactosaminyltransferase bre-4-like isoform X3 [Crassostrea angulata]
MREVTVIRRLVSTVAIFYILGYTMVLLLARPKENLMCQTYHQGSVLYPIPNFNDTHEKDMVSRFTWLGNGGYSLPYGCRSKERVAILIPYRDREKQLRILLSNLHPLLYRQGLEYRIYVIEQADTKPFNKGMLYNIAYSEAKTDNHTCFVFHDVDLIPENDQIMYNCVRSPMHLSRAIDSFNYRIIMNKLSIFRFRNNVARYTMLKHKRTPVNTARYQMLMDSPWRFKVDGLSTLTYIPPTRENHQLYTRILVRT